MTGFYRFLLLRIEEASKKSEWGCQELKNTTLCGVFYFCSTPEFEPG